MGTTVRNAAAVLVCCLTLGGGAATAHAQSSSAQGYDETSVLGVTRSGGPHINGSGQSETTATGRHHGLVVKSFSDTTTARGGAAPRATTTTQRQGGGRLPFTGLDLALMGLLGTVLIGTGISVRRTTRIG